MVLITRRKWKEIIEMPNNSCWVGTDKRKKIFKATPFSAGTILRDAKNVFHGTNMEVIMNIREKCDTPYASNVYEIYSQYK